MRLRAFALALLPLGGLVGCGDPDGPLRVERVEPHVDARLGSRVVFLNQDVVVHFSEPLDPLSVTPLSVRVVDDAGQRVAGGELLVGTRSLRFRPRPPLRDSLDDGSLTPGGRYRLELIGMPTSYAVRSSRGHALERSLSVPFVAPADPTEFGLQAPFLPVDGGTTTFAVDLSGGRLPRLLAEERQVEIALTLPPLPSSVRTDAVTVQRLDFSRPEPEALPLQSLEVVPGRRSETSHFGTTLRLRFPEDLRFRIEDHIYLLFESTPERALRDYRGRPILPPPEPLRLQVEAAGGVPLPGFVAEKLTWRDAEDAQVGFEWGAGALRPRVRVEAGDGRDGPLWVAGGTAELDGDAAPGTPWQFESIRVAAGARLRVRAGELGAVLRCCGSVRIDGELELVDSSRDIPWQAGESPDVESLLRSSGVAIVAGGDLRIRGRVTVSSGAGGTPSAGAQSSPWTLVAAGAVDLSGEIPAGTALALEPGAPVAGVVSSLRRFTVPLTRGAPSTAGLEAAAWTDWLPLPDVLPELSDAALDVLLERPVAGLRGFVQLAQPRAEDPSVPLDDLPFLDPPRALPLATPLRIGGAKFVRVGLRARWAPGADPLPSAAGIEVLLLR